MSIDTDDGRGHSGICYWTGDGRGVVSCAEQTIISTSGLGVRTGLDNPLFANGDFAVPGGAGGSIELAYSRPGVVRCAARVKLSLELYLFQMAPVRLGFN